MEIHRIVCGNVNCYIVAENGNAILIDTGRKKYREKVLKQCRKFSVNLIVLTHGHLDHCQNAAYLADALSVPIAMHEKDRNLIPDNRMQLLSAKTFLGKIVLSVSLQSFEKDVLDVFEPTVYLKDGDNLSAYGVDARVVEMPGHTNGSIGLKIGDGLFVGDALMNMFFPTVAMLYMDEKMMKQSARQISGMGKLKIYFGHGKPVNNRTWI
ncbi:MAG: MBL fold metallo-hydrolase [Acetatifactor sp.]|nr:MBL fold metallo-hydrolase [Acetatifactor sp.]MDE7113851.1 MBL fold metallo-hydrolase [Acetatifactor sp.]